MKLRISRKLVSLVMAGALSASILSIPKRVGGKKESVVTKVDSVVEEIYKKETPSPIEVVLNNQNDEVIIDDTKETIDEYNESNINEEKEIELSYYVRALDNSKIYSKPVISSDKQVGVLYIDETLPLVCETNDKWYEVIYDDQSAFVQKDNLELVKSYDLVNKIPVLDSICNYLTLCNMVRTTSRVNVRKEANTKCKIYDLLDIGTSLPLIEKYNDEWYKVDYKGKEAYVYAKYVEAIKGYSPIVEIANVGYTTRKTPLYDVDTNEKIVDIPKRESAEVYAMNDEYYLAGVNGTVGFIDKKYVQFLGEECMVVDISSQNLKMYADNGLFVDTPVVTGDPSTPTYCGLFYVFKKEDEVYWKEFDLTVHNALDFNRGIWIHPSPWRGEDEDDYGYEIYIIDGSHGCVNVNPIVMIAIYKKAKIGTPVLVKK